MANENENSQSDIDALFMTDDSQPDVFSEMEQPTTLDSNPFGASGSATTSETDVFGDMGLPTTFESNPFGENTTSGVDAAIEPQAEEIAPKGKKGKKTKKTKTAASKPAKVKKEKAPKAKVDKSERTAKVKAPKSDYVSSPFPYYLLAGLLFVGLVVATVVKLISGVSPVSVAIFDVVGLVLLAVPFALLSQLRKSAIEVWNMFTAIVLMAILLGCMTLLSF